MFGINSKIVQIVVFTVAAIGVGVVYSSLFLYSPWQLSNLV